ncbi:MAG: hypothetical protein V4706_04545 [Pseudomonadota bacterium]
MKPATILISGAGQLGSRYLQGLASCTRPLRVHVHDVDRASLTRAQQRWDEVAKPGGPHEVSLHNTVTTIPTAVNVAIVATTARWRPDAVMKIAAHADVGAWILEKVLAQNEVGLKEISRHIGSQRAWVNTPRRGLDWHQQIKTHLGVLRPLHLKVSGSGWGLACNSIHFLDMFSWWVDEPLVYVDTSELARDWIESKRPGNWEVLGKLRAYFAGGSTIELNVKDGELFYEFELDDGHGIWTINEDAGTASRSDGLDLPGRLPFQSEVSGALIESILTNGTCELPTLEQSLVTHRPFLAALLAHWRATVDPQADAVPIT